MKKTFLISLIVISLLAVSVVYGAWYDIFKITGEATKSTKQAFECKETDAGVDDFTAGIAVSSQDNEVKIDTCSVNILKEYSCSKNGKVTSKNVRCAGGCEQKNVYFGEKTYNADQCVSLCEDSDEGFNLNVKGTVTTPFAETSDYCVDEKTVMEMSCAEKSKDKWRVSKSPISDYAKIIARERNCKKGEVCRGGACVKKTESSGILIEKDFGSLKYLGSRDDDDCDIVQGPKGECKLHVGYYGIGKYSNEPRESDTVGLAGIETHTEKFTNTEVIRGILEEFARGENVNVGSYEDDGKDYIIIRQRQTINQEENLFGEETLIIGWYSGTNVIVLVFTIIESKPIDDQDVKRIFEEYTKKYPSELQEFKEESLCVDTDYWQDQYTSGSVIDGNGQYRDSCVVPKTDLEGGYYALMDGVRYDAIDKCSGDDCFVAESVCDKGRQEFVKLKCEFGYSCKNGKCVNNLKKGECFDSDGLDFLNKGYAYDYWQNRPAEDFCIYRYDEKTGESTSNLVLYEYYCEKSSAYSEDIYLASKKYDCEEEGKTCDNGRCVEKTVASSGGGGGSGSKIEAIKPAAK